MVNFPRQVSTQRTPVLLTDRGADFSFRLVEIASDSNRFSRFASLFLNTLVVPRRRGTILQTLTEKFRDNTSPFSLSLSRYRMKIAEMDATRIQLSNTSRKYHNGSR